MVPNTNLQHSLIGISGWSGSGKTTLIEKLVPILIDHGLRVNVVKNSHHNVELEPPHKDSARIRRAGAAEVLLTSPFRFVITHELRNEKEPPLKELLSRMQSADITLVEGFRNEAIPHLEVYRPILGKQPMYLENRHIKAVASDTPQPQNLPLNMVWLNLNNINQIAKWILNQ